jgi:hypothetical protein
VIRGFGIYFAVAAVAALLVRQSPTGALIGVVLAVGFFGWANARQE